MSRKIVVIDDEADVLQIVRAALVTRNYTVFTTSDGLQGLEIAAAERPDLIICDLMMPRTSGLEVIKRLRKDAELRTIPVMILSALGTDERPPEFWIQTLGVADYMQKPFDPLDLLGRVEYLFRRSTYVSAQPHGDARPAKAAQRPTSPPPVRPSRGNAPDDLEQFATQVPMDMAASTPAQVVREFIESYNRQDFATEFHCLDREMTGGGELRSYVERRRQTYMDEKSEGRVQRVVAVDEEKVSLNMAKVVISREDMVAGLARPRKESYMLKKTHEGWKIIGVRAMKNQVS